MTEPDYAAELDKIRAAYIGSHPRQRLGVIAQRLDNPAHGPNLLVTHVSAVEALARSLAMHANAGTKTQLRELYRRYRDRKVNSLITEYLAGLGFDSPGEFFGADTWRKFAFAVSYRNMLVHECTYLGQDKYPHLIEACETVLEKLSGLAGISR